jgi:hypothetical protein
MMAEAPHCSLLYYSLTATILEMSNSAVALKFFTAGVDRSVAGHDGQCITTAALFIDWKIVRDVKFLVTQNNLLHMIGNLSFNDCA